MRIIVCIKELTDYLIERQDTSPRRPAGILVRINPQDLVALEEALILRERLGSEVIALSLGTDERALRRALTLGVDRAILVGDSKQSEGDWSTTSLILARAALQIGFDLILCGTWRLDDMDSAVGPGIAEHLDIPIIMHAVTIELPSESARNMRVCKSLPKGVRETYELPLPGVVTVAKGLAQPRYVPISGKCYRQGLAKSVEHMTVSELGIAPEALSPKTTTLEVSEMRPRTRLGTKVTGLSLEEKLRLLTVGTSRIGDKRELVIHQPQVAARKLLEKLLQWRSERRLQ